MKKLFMVLAATVVCGACLFTSCKKDKEVPELNLSEKIIGKWINTERNGEPMLTNKETVFTFISTTKALVSASRSSRSVINPEWMDRVEADVNISGNKVTVTFHPDEHTTSVHECNITDINGSEFTANEKVTVKFDGNVIISEERLARFEKATADYRQAVIGLWECTGLSGGETYNDANARLEFLDDGTYRYYRMDDGGQWQAVTTREFQDYFVDGTLLATRWKIKGEDELREWWEIESLSGNEMVWTALRQNADGSTFQQKTTWKKIDLKVAEKIIGKWMPADIDGRPAPTNQKMVTTFVSTTKAIASSSKVDFSEKDNKWNVYREDDVKIEGNKVTLTGHPNEHTTLINEYIVSTINDAELVGKWKHLTFVDGVETVNTENDICLVKVNVDYRAAILGTWEGRCTSEGSEFDDGQVHRWSYTEDGNFVYYVQNNEGKWVPSENTLNEYFVDGNLLCTRWVDNGEEYREWWEIDIDDDKMNWTALRQNPGGEPFTVTFEMTLVPGIALIAKGGQIDYWRQIETAFRSICQDKGFNAYYSSTSADNAYYEQIAAVEELSRCREDALKGIIFAPCYGPDGQSAEEEVAALASERGIPVIILDVPVSTTSPLASRPFIGTDNTAAGKALAENVTADKVIAFAKVNTPGVERAQAFKSVKPETELITVSESAVSEVEAALDDYEDFVFFNGSNLVDVLATLKNAGKRVYTFDIYGDFLDELIAGGTCLQGIMAQNTFAMARRAVDAVLADSQQGQFVPAFYITISNIASPDVLPYLLYYNKLD